MGLFDKSPAYTPVWFMRQAGRYHRHYQNIRQEFRFYEMCKRPQLALEITCGPINDFNFDAAILFSDLLFPLEHLGMGLSYDMGPPKLSFQLHSPSDLDRLKITTPATSFYNFQKEALILLREKLPSDKTLLGFVGAPFTLYTYATSGAHSGALITAKTGLYDGRFEKFIDILYPSLLTEMLIQAEGGADAVCIFDTAAGELSHHDFTKFIIPTLKKLTHDFKKSHPNKKIIYYSKHTHLNYLESIEDDNIDCLGIDWRIDLAIALKRLGKDYFIQGNIDPCWLHLNWQTLESHLENLKEHLYNQDLPLERWIFGLGHGVLPKTPEENVKKTVEWVHQMLGTT